MYGHELDIYSLDFSYDNRFIVSGSGDGKAKIWSMDTGKCEHTLGNDEIGPKEGVTSMIYKTLYFFLIYILGVAISPDGRFVAAGSLDCVVRLWDTQTGKHVESFKGHDDSVYSVAFSPDGKTLASGSLDKVLLLLLFIYTYCRHWNCGTCLASVVIVALPPCPVIVTMCSVWPFRKTANGSFLVPRIAPCNSGTLAPMCCTWCCKVTRIAWLAWPCLPHIIDLQRVVAISVPVFGRPCHYKKIPCCVLFGLVKIIKKCTHAHCCCCCCLLHMAWLHNEQNPQCPCDSQHWSGKTLLHGPPMPLITTCPLKSLTTLPFPKCSCLCIQRMKRPLTIPYFNACWTRGILKFVTHWMRIFPIMWIKRVSKYFVMRLPHLCPLLLHGFVTTYW